MPRNSKRSKLIATLDNTLSAAIKHASRLKLFGLPTTGVDEFIYSCYRLRISVQRKRYLIRGKYKKRTEKFREFTDTEGADCLDESEFRFHFRMGRETFWELVSQLKDHPAFKRKNSDSRGPAPKPPSHQILVLLKYYGCEGNQASSVALSRFFGVAVGVIDACRNNALEALLWLEDRTYIWPDAEERRQIARRIKEQYKFPNCVGLIDGTLLPLERRPILHGENYLSRKRFYAIVMLVVCDDNGRILYHHIGWPGSVHDNRVWRNCKLNKQSSDYFSNRQYLLGDSAFTASTIMIPPFKSAAGGTLSNNRTAFNTLLAKPRVKSEHCIGILKGRFPFLRCIRLKLANRNDMKRIINYVRGTVVLHNFLRNDDVDDEWMEDVHEGEDDLDPEPSTTTNSPNYARRDELFYYLSELVDTTIN